jgi:hypothetical protein
VPTVTFKNFPDRVWIKQGTWVGMERQIVDNKLILVSKYLAWRGLTHLSLPNVLDQTLLKIETFCADTAYWIWTQKAQRQHPLPFQNPGYWTKILVSHLFYNPEKEKKKLLAHFFLTHFGTVSVLEQMMIYRSSLYEELLESGYESLKRGDWESAMMFHQLLLLSDRFLEKCQTLKLRPHRLKSIILDRKEIPFYLYTYTNDPFAVNRFHALGLWKVEDTVEHWKEQKIEKKMLVEHILEILEVFFKIDLIPIVAIIPEEVVNLICGYVPQETSEETSILSGKTSRDRMDPASLSELGELCRKYDQVCLTHGIKFKIELGEYEGALSSEFLSRWKSSELPSVQKFNLSPLMRSAWSASSDARPNFSQTSGALTNMISGSQNSVKFCFKHYPELLKKFNSLYDRIVNKS